MTILKRSIPVVFAICAAFTSGSVNAQDNGQAGQQWLKIYFETGSATISPDQAATLDVAVRTFREGDPFVMIVAGSADTVGPAELNLGLSIERARAVAEGLSARGIPIERLQVLGRGNSDLEVATSDGVAEPENRVVEISWR
jgi:outer membrane protein OmpA-like peptidoglycan-associated protein